jgi:hypothetical protein
VHVAFRFADDYRHTTLKWMDQSEYICILSVENEIELKDLLERARWLAIPCADFMEPDFDNSLTAIALAPCPESKKLCSNLKLALK